MSRGAWVLIVAVGILVLAGGGTVAVAVLDRSRWRRALRDAFASYNLDPDWGEALGETETGLRGLVNDTGRDAIRGGSYGATQISQRTARAFGFDGDMHELVSDPELAADLSAQMVADGFAELTPTSVLRAQPDAPYRPVHYGAPGSFEDMLAVWNAGRPEGQLRDGSDTLTKYIPRGQKFLAGIEARGGGAVS